MNNSIVENSASVLAVMQGVVIAKTYLRRLDDELKVVNKYSQVGRLFSSAMRGIYRGVGKLYANAHLLRNTGDVIIRALQILIKWMTRSFYNIYCGSLFLEIVDRAVVNSRWLR